MSKPVIETHGISKDYVMGDVVVHALRNVDVKVEPGEFVAIMGPSGSGKSTFMNLVGCLDRPSAGEYFLNGEAVARLGDNQLADIRNKYLGFVFQNYNLLPRTSALRNVELPLMYAGNKNRHQLAVEALERVGLEQRMHHKPNELSGGQQQRVAIARAIVNNPVLLLGDEPTGNLDTRTGAEIMVLFQDLNAAGTTVMIVTHEEEIARHCKRIIRFRDGMIVADEKVENPVDAHEELRNMPDADAMPTPSPVPSGTPAFQA
jgi:putative ABC transport system ATP-binding protein